MKLFYARSWDQSIVRRSLVLFALIAPAIFLNFLLLYVASQILLPESFGIFYLSITTINILFAPSAVLNFVYMRYIAKTKVQDGLSAAFVAINYITRIVYKWGGLFSIATFLFLSSLAYWLDVQSFFVILLITLIAYTSYIADVGRAALMALQRVLYFGLYSASWMAARFILGLAGIYFIGTVWSALTGILFSGILVFLVFFLRLPHHDKEVSAVHAHLPRPLTIMPVALGYGLFAALSHVDLFVTYLLVDNHGLGIFSSSALLPKAILVLTFPIVQMLFPILVIDTGVARLRFIMLVKGVIATLIAAGTVALIINMVSNHLCGGFLGIPQCSHSLLTTMLLSILPLSVLRVLVVAQIARGLSWHPTTLIIPIIVYLFFTLFTARTLDDIAWQFMVFAYIALFYYMVLCSFTTTVLMPTSQTTEESSLNVIPDSASSLQPSETSGKGLPHEH